MALGPHPMTKPKTIKGPDLEPIELAENQLAAKCDSDEITKTTAGI